MKKAILIAIPILLFFAIAQYWALKIAPPDQMMGDVYRILFVHVPAAWNALLLLTVSFVACLFYLIRKDLFWDRLAASATEIAVVLTGLALALGSIWGKPTWGVWWTWDPRLTTTALLFILYVGYLMLRRLIDDPIYRARIAAGIGVMIFLNVPIVYFSVKWWRSLHQVQSTPSTMSPEMFMPLRLNALAFLLLAILFIVIRMRLSSRQSALEERESLPPPGGTP